MQAKKILSHEEQLAADEARLAELGYKQRLTRAMGLFSNFSVGFTYLSPVVGVYSLFALGLASFGPAMWWTIPFVLVGQFLVVLPFAEIGSDSPIAGGIYQWSRRLVGERYAWFAGWFYGWALLVNSAGVASAAALWLAPLLGYDITPRSTIITAVAVLLVVGLINLSGVRKLSFMSKVGVSAEVLMTVVLGTIFVFFTREQSFSSLMHTELPGGATTSAFLVATLFGAYIFYGFEACGDVAEEVVNPSKRVPQAMILTLVLGGAAALLITIGMILAVPDLGAIMSGQDGNPILTIFNSALGTVGAKFALTALFVTYVSCLLSSQATCTRLVYSYGRDGMIVGGRFLSKIYPKTSMPAGSVAVSFLIPTIICFLPSATIAHILVFATVGTYIAFTFVTVASVIARLRGWTPEGYFRLGRWSWPVLIGAITYQVFMIWVMCTKAPALGTSFFDKWFVPISAAFVGLIGLIYFAVFRPKRTIHADSAHIPAKTTEALAEDTPALVRPALQVD